MAARRAGYAIGSAIPLLLFIPVGARIREVMPAGHSLTEFAYARFGSGMYLLVLLVSVFYMFIFLAAEMTGIAGALALVADVPLWQTSLLIGGFVLVYTTYGGLLASIVTDTVQTLVILPLLAVGFGGALLSLGGTSEFHATVVSADPTLLDPGFGPGLKFGLYVAFALLGANMLNQASGSGCTPPTGSAPSVADWASPPSSSCRCSCSPACSASPPRGWASRNPVPPVSPSSSWWRRRSRRG